MHLVEQYALSCGVKIDKPQVEVNYFPLPFSDYIVIHPTSGMDAKNYDYYTDVIELILPYFKKNNIEIVQMGGKDDVVLPNCYALNGVTSLSQSFFIIKNCRAIIGNDSFSTHIASGFNKNIVSLYSNLYKECCGPYWGDSNKQILLQADRKGEKPSFSATETQKVVNNIKPEEIARGVLRLLDIESNLGSYETLYVGKDYHSTSLEIIPNFFTPNAMPPNQGINIRLDYDFNPENAAHWAANYKTHLIIDRPLEPKYFRLFQKNLLKISVKLSPEIDEGYIKALQNLGCPLELVAEKDENLQKFQIKFLDWSVDSLSYPSKKDLDLRDNICDNTFYKSSKTILSNGKQYSSKAAWLAHQEKNRTEKIIDDIEFWKELDHFRIYNP